MKRKLLFATAVVFALSLYAQTQSVNNFSFTYRHIYQDCEEIVRLSECLCVLDIEGNKSHFYNKDFERGTDLTDSLLRKGLSATEIVAVKKKEGISSNAANTNVFKNYPEDGKITVTENIGKIYLYEEAMPELEWNIEEGDTIIAGYACYKASTRYRGRIWTAFYTPDIPIGEGPWKLCGLPGVILYAKDSQNKFIYDCIGISNNLQRPIKTRKEKIQRCNAKEMADLLTLVLKDMDELMFRMSGVRVKHYNPDGTQAKSLQPLTACLKEIPE